MARSSRKPSSRRLPSILAIDLRGLALLRVGLAIIVVLDLVSRLRSFGAHYGSAGVLPRDVYLAEFETTWHISLHLLTSSDALNIALFIAGIAAAILLAVGYRTKLATIATWLLLISVHSRNPFVLQGGDEILRVFLFWGMFLPLGARLSIDSALSSNHADAPPDETFTSMATLCLVGQLVMLYAFTTVSKLMHPVWWRDGLGVYFALGVEQFTTRAGLLLREATSLLRPLSFITLVLQALAPVLLLIPLGRERLRAMLPLVMIGLHLGFALAMELGFFSYIVAVAWLAFLAPSVLDRIFARLPDIGPWLRARRAALSFTREARPMAAPKPINNPVYKAALATLLVYVFWWNMAGVDRDLFGMPDRLRPIAETLRLEQRWKMFSNPPRWSQWFIASGIRRDGTEVDLLTREPPDFTKPALVSATYPTQRWRKYMSNIAEANGSPHRKHFAAYLCRQANRGRARPAVASVRLTMMRQATPPQPGMSRQPPDRVVLGTWSCTDAKRVPSSPTRKASPDVPEFD